MTIPPDFQFPPGDRGNHAVLSAIGALLSALGSLFLVFLPPPPTRNRIAGRAPEEIETLT